MPKPKTYKCTQCDKVYKTARGLAKHILAIHPPVVLGEKKQAAIEPPSAVSEPVAPPIEPANLTINLEQPKEDANKLWSWKYGKWVLLVAALLFLWFMFLQPWLNERAIDRNNQKVEAENKKIDSIYIRLDSLSVKQNQLSDSIRFAVDVSSEAKAVATKSATDLNQVRRESEKSFQSIKKSSDELLKALDKANSVIDIDRHLDSIERARATRPKMFQN